MVFVIDEMVSGFKWGLKGAQSFFGVTPDLATWGKGIANGFSACALTGRADIMELGGIRRDGEDKLFLISSTHGAETIGLAALMATINEFKKHEMIDSNWQRGEFLHNQLNKIINAHGLIDYLEVIGYPCLLALTCRNSTTQIDDAFRTLMMQEMIARGVLFQGLFYITWSHQQAELDRILKAFDESCAVYRIAIKAGTVSKLLLGKPAKPVFRKKI